MLLRDVTLRERKSIHHNSILSYVLQAIATSCELDPLQNLTLFLTNTEIGKAYVVTATFSLKSVG
jgi:hypothetical protein